MDITRAWTFLLGLVFLNGVTSYSNGAPPTVCLGHRAQHDEFQFQTNTCPYTMTFSSATYTPSQEIDVTITSAANGQFMGFLIYAHRTVGDQEKPVGTYSSFPNPKARMIDCVNLPDAGLTNNNSEPITTLQFTWRAPDTNVGNIQFKYMIVEEFEIFWPDVQAPLLESAEPYVEPAPGWQYVSDSTPDIDWDMCGVTKGCFLYPRICHGADCTAAVTYTPNYKGYLFEMFVSGSEYISVGFSHDEKMSKDHVHACVAGLDTVSVQNGYNPALQYMRTFKDGLTEMSVKRENGKLTCRFQRTAVMSVYTDTWGNETWDLNNDYYLFMAWGDAESKSLRLAKHNEYAVSDGMVDFRELGVVRGSAFPLLTQIHGTLSMLAWIVFVGITTIMARYYKDFKSESTLFGMKYWIQLHRYCGGIAWVLTAVGFVVIFIQVQDLSETAVVHSYLGIAVMAVCSLQMISGIFRPDGKAKARPAFNIIHWLVGKGSHILSAVAIFFAYSSDTVPAAQQKFGYISTGVWVVAQLLWELLFEIRRFRLSKKEKKTSGSSTCDNALLYLYIFTLLVLAVCQLMAIFLY